MWVCRVRDEGLYSSVSVSKEFRSDLSGYFWPKVSHEVAIKVSEGDAAI